MSDDLSSRIAPKDPNRVNLDEPDELQYWSEEFCITVEHLKHVVALRGTDVVELRAYLEK